MEKTVKKITAYSFLYLLLASLLLPMGETAFACSTEKYDNIMTISPGMLYPLRGPFRDYYGEKMDLNIQYFRNFGGSFYAGIRGGYIFPDKGDLGIKYSNFNLAPITRYYLSADFIKSYLTGGLGFNFRKLEIGGIDVDDFAPSFILGTGVEMNIYNSLVFGVELNVDYIYDGDTDRGGFGNTGGLNLLLNIGYLF